MTFTALINADYHQGDEFIFSDLSRGRQCVANCIVFLIKAHYQKCDFQKWSKHDLHNILHGGDVLYQKLKDVDEHDYLHPSCIPCHMKFDNTIIKNHVYETCTGSLSPHFKGVHPLFSLENALATISNGIQSKFMLFICMGTAVGLVYHEPTGIYYLFDPHARDINGMPSERGKCVLGILSNITEISSFLRTLASSLCSLPLTDIQFDLHRIDFCLIKRNSCKKCRAHHMIRIPNVLSYSNDLHQKRKSVKEITDEVKRQKTQEPKEFPTNVRPSHIASQSVGQNPNITHWEMENLNKEFTPNANERNGNVEVLIDNNLDRMSNAIPEEVTNIEVAEKSQDIAENELSKINAIFQSRIKDGPMYVCCSCMQTFFRHSVCLVDNVKIKNQHLASICLTDLKSVDNKEWICKTCLLAVQQERIPTCSSANNMQFPPIPEELKLTHLEERLISPRLAFMQLRELPRGGQLNLKGNIVNVPADVNTTVKLLPRMLDNTETIAVKLKRKLSYKHCVAFEKIRPNKVFEAARWLIENSSLFRNEGVEVDSAWLKDYEELQHVEENVQSQVSESDCTLPSKSNSNDNAVVSTSDEWTEDDNFHDRPTGNTDTVLQAMDFREYNQILSLAPGENQTPLGLFQDYNSEFLAFPTIYCGQVRPDNSLRSIPVHYSTICKWELRHVDRRTAMCIPNIFFKLKRLQIKQIKDKVSLAVRKCKTQGRKMTACEVLSSDFIDNLVKQDDGFRVLRNLRGSPPYWEQAKKDVFAMIRQLGIPTWFCSFSAAETKWTPLLICLSKLVHGKDLSSDEVNSLTWEEKCILIKSDPVTCARYFDHRFQSYLACVLKSEKNPIGEIQDYFYRVEFQQRGSPHVHMLVWIKNAPVYNGNNQKDVENFIDNYVTCKKDEEIPNLVNYQTHRHARTCRKKGKAICRFNFPLPPMPYTVVLDPLHDEEKKMIGKENYQKVATFLSEVKNAHTQPLNFEEFLQEMGMNLETYLLCIQSTLTVSKVFLKRSLEETRVNNYNKILLKCWEANLDIQYILDPYACVSYIVSYISKGQRGLSNLLFDACQEAKRKDTDIRQQVRRIGNQFLSHVEIGAQEAAYLVLQMHLRQSTRDVVFIDTNPAERRTVLLKSFTALKELPSSSTNVESDNILKRYMRRPREMMQYCYADFVSWFDTSFEKCNKTSTCLVKDNELPEDEYTCDLEDDIPGLDEEDPDLVQENFFCEREMFEFKDGTIMKKRRKQKVVRYHNISLNEDKEGHYRQMIMLFTKWRNEKVDLLHGCSSYEESYLKMRNVIEPTKARYIKMVSDIDERILEDSNDLEDYQRISVLPENEHQEAIDESEGPSISETYGCFDPGTTCRGDENQHPDQYDLGQDLGIARKSIVNEQLPLNEMIDDDYRSMIQNLNEKQMIFFYNILHHFKTSDAPLYTFLTGGAGVGKSVLLRSLYQALIKFLNNKEGENPDNIKILLCAPTGKAAHNIGGNTIHSAFGIPVGRGFAFKPLDMHQLDSMRCKYFHLKVVFIDEVSMVGAGMFNFINLRLQEIKGCCKPFGGVSIITFGDLFQLKPVMDSWIFSQQRKGLESIGTNLWQEYFTIFELNEIMRQKDDLEFAQLLNRMREGNQFVSQDIQTLKNRILQKSNDANSDDRNLDCVPHLYTTREECNLHNFGVLQRLPSRMKTVVHAIDNVSGEVDISLKQKIVSKISDDAGKTMGLQRCLNLAIGPPFELCLNVCVEDGLTNGTSCFIKMFDYRVKDSERLSIVWVELDNPKSGAQWRQKYCNLYRSDIPRTWTPILEVTRSFSIQHYKSYHVVRRQFPLQMAAGKTIHKAQGSTLDGAVVHFGQRKNDHIHYVGLSRVKNLSNLHILELNEKKISVSESVKEEMQRLRSSAKLQLKLPVIHDLATNGTIICFHNCRSLKKHINDLRKDIFLQKVDVLGLCETRVYKSDLQLCINNFSHFCADHQQSKHGMSIFHKNNINFPLAFSINGIELLSTKVYQVNVCFIYCPPRNATKQNFAALMEVLQSTITLSEPTILMGDFNQDVLKSSSICNLLEQNYSFHQLMTSVTTDYGSCLDHIYVNFANNNLILFGTFESYYSDHKPVFIKLNH